MTIKLRFGAGVGADDVPNHARTLERLGFDYGSFGEHFMRGNPPAPTNLALPLMAAAAGATEKLRVVSSILLAPLYHPVLLAKLATSVDIVSKGRLTLGVGIGGEFPVEFQAMGLSTNARGSRSNEVLSLLKKLWTEEHITYNGKFFQLEDVTLKPTPLQQPHPPIWIAGRREGAMKRTATYGDGWLPYFYSPEQYKNSFIRINEFAQENGRDLSEFEWAHFSFISINKNKREAAKVAASRLGSRYSSRADMESLVGSYCILGDVEYCIDRMSEYFSAGVRTFLFSWMCDPRDIPRHLDLITKEIIPHFRQKFEK